MPTLNARPISTSASIPPDIMDELIAWSVKLNSGTASDVDQQRFQEWRAFDPMHEHAWQTLHAMEQNFTAIPTQSRQLVANTIARADAQTITARQRKPKLKALAMTTVTLLAAALLINQVSPWQQPIHYATHIGQRATFQLADGTQLMLNTNSSVDVRYTLLKREIVLNHGEVYLITGHDTDALFGRRHFWVNTAQAKFEAIGTRFSVYQQANTTQLHVAEGIVAMHVAQQPEVRAYANDTYRMQGASALPIKAETPHSDPMAWVDGVIIAKQMCLEHLMTELSRYQALPLSYEDNTGNLVVSGVFQLNRNDPAEHALQTLGHTLPIHITRQHGQLLIRKK
ncbi:FecR domain-containing protein [Methylophilus sp. OH31]|uniref:FecR family protein n=1 Tax=Methylophilus sp. OH31 TaxID=1387312 RepID=UPI001F5AECC5|nr:FecR domain-containing protein [Methylophilus sp. OH31]